MEKLKLFFLMMLKKRKNLMTWNLSNNSLAGIQFLTLKKLMEPKLAAPLSLFFQGKIWMKSQEPSLSGFFLI